MNCRLAVFNGTGVNRYGFAFSVGALESALRQCWKYGVPSCISHDMHRLIAWSKGMSLYLEPGLVRLAGLVFSPESSEEEKELRTTFEARIKEQIHEGFKPHARKLYKKLSGLLSKEHYPLMPACAAIVDNNLVSKKFPDFFKNKDKNGLVPLSGLRPIGPGVFEIDGLLLFAHPFFRRSLSRYNSLNTPFLSRLQNVFKSYDLETKIAIDPDMIGLADTYTENIELEYWWGPKFDNELSKIEFGVSKHAANDDLKMFHGISATEFWWHNQNDIKTLECEELRDIPSYGINGDRFGCRYVHSMLDQAKFVPNHIDGAVRLYSEAAMIERLETDIAKSGKKSNYRKLWRIDGEIEISVWKELMNDYFRDNRLVGEYLGAVENNDYNSPRELITTTSSSPLSNYVPCVMHSNEGIRISVSYHEKSHDDNNLISFIPTDFFTNKNNCIYYIEYDSTEVVKILRRNGFNVVVPTDAILIAFEDMTLNFPLVHHSGENSLGLAEATQDAFLSLLTAWSGKKDDRVVTFTMSIAYDDKDVYFSYAGHVNDLLIWFKSKESTLPKSKDMIAQWAETASTYIDNIFQIKLIDTPPLYDLLQKDGMLVFKRRFLKNEEYQIQYDESSGCLMSKLILPMEEDKLLDVISSGELAVACAFLVRDSQCSKCKSSYHLCPCSKYLDESVIQNMTDVTMFGLFWTNRKA